MQTYPCKAYYFDEKSWNIAKKNKYMKGVVNEQIAV